jgi:hypothetical protein
MLLLGKQIDGSESPETVYAKYQELRVLFAGVVED